MIKQTITWYTHRNPTRDGKYLVVTNRGGCHMDINYAGGHWNCIREIDGTINTEHEFEVDMWADIFGVEQGD